MSEIEIWRDVFLVTKRYVQAFIRVDKLHASDPARRLEMIATLLNDYRADLKPYADMLREQYDIGPNDWQQKIVACIFGIDGATNDRAWWGRTLTAWWEEFKKDAERIKYGF